MFMRERIYNRKNRYREFNIRCRDTKDSAARVGFGFPKEPPLNLVRVLSSS